MFIFYSLLLFQKIVIILKHHVAIHLTLGQKINKHNQKLVGRGLGSDKSNDTGGYVKIMQ